MVWMERDGLVGIEVGWRETERWLSFLEEKRWILAELGERRLEINSRGLNNLRAKWENAPGLKTGEKGREKRDAFLVMRNGG